MSDLMVSYEANGTDITLTQDDIKNFIVSGDDKNPVTPKEMKLFMELCRAQKLNPFLREVYLVKFSDKANIITGKDVFLKRARANPDFRGFKAGIIVENEKGFEKREGTFYMQGRENLVGGWADVYIKDWEVPFEHSVSITEFNKGVSLWKSMPAVMIRKVALVQALREAFPDDLSQLYASEEIEKYDNNIVDEDSFSSASYNQGESLNANNALITDKQRARMFALVDGDKVIVRESMAKYGYTGSSSEITRADYDDICSEIEAAVVALKDDPEFIKRKMEREEAAAGYEAAFGEELMKDMD